MDDLLTFLDLCFTERTASPQAMKSRWWISALFGRGLDFESLFRDQNDTFSLKEVTPLSLLGRPHLRPFAVLTITRTSFSSSFFADKIDLSSTRRKTFLTFQSIRGMGIDVPFFPPRTRARPPT